MGNGNLGRANAEGENSAVGSRKPGKKISWGNEGQ